MHVIIHGYPGRTDEQKKDISERIVKDLGEVFGTKPRGCSVVFKETPGEQWEELYNTEIIAYEKQLYHKPEYVYVDHKLVFPEKE